MVIPRKSECLFHIRGLKVSDELERRPGDWVFDSPYLNHDFQRNGSHGAP